MSQRCSTIIKVFFCAPCQEHIQSVFVSLVKGTTYGLAKLCNYGAICIFSAATFILMKKVSIIRVDKTDSIKIQIISKNNTVVLKKIRCNSN